MSTPAPEPRAAADWIGCECCGLVAAFEPGRHDPDAAPWRCARCAQPLHWRKPMSVQRTWAYLIAATVLYIPANVLPIMSTTQAFHTAEHTLAGGIAELWTEGDYFLATIVFIASIAVPLLKIGVLALLAWTVQRAPQWRRFERAKLFGIVEAVGHWSMLDVYVVLLLVAMVRFGSVASADPGPGLLSFAAVVILTMLAAHSFDPRLIWQDTHDG